MSKTVLFVAALIVSVASYANGNNPDHNNDPHEKSFYDQAGSHDMALQQTLRQSLAWQSFQVNHPSWRVHFDENSHMPQRMYGPGIEVQSNDFESIAQELFTNELSSFGVGVEEVQLVAVNKEGKNQIAIFKQTFQGKDILDSQLLIKLSPQGKVILIGLDMHASPSPTNSVVLNTEGAENAGYSYISEALNVVVTDEVKLLPVSQNGYVNSRWVYEAKIYTLSSTGIPSRYYTLIDAESGEVWYCANEIHHHGPKCAKSGCKTPKPVQPAVLTTTIRSIVTPFNPYEPNAVLEMSNMNLSAGGMQYQTNIDGQVTINPDPSSISFSLSGPWSTVFTSGTTPSGQVEVTGSPAAIQFGDEVGNLKERSAFYHVNLIHDHAVAVLPGLTSMDFSLPTNIDVAGECNAFYDGASINFFAAGGGCNATALVSDIVYHEYGHGINDNYYSQFGQGFSNGAMGEGYADFWGMSLLDTPLLGIGFYDDDEDPLRRYDIDPKVYPDDIVSEVHADGEIICGAWWDTHLLLGADWDVTFDLWAEAYNGLQATTFNGNEGEAFTNVLLDVLQADDDDDDISNGTPNINAILEGFAIHGITLISQAEIEHTAPLFSIPSANITIEAELDIDSDYIDFLNTVTMSYKINEGDWVLVEMESSNAQDYTYELSEQAAGTVIKYYFEAVDIFGTGAGTSPIGMTDQMGTTSVPHTLLVGVVPQLTEDQDENSDFGNWELGVDGDNATTGEWESTFPIGSGDSFTEQVAPWSQHTEGGEFCFITGQSSTQGDGVGANDVDAGHTTLQSDMLDLSEMTSPVLSYWRWYTNSPATGANPGADWWQVQISDDGGNNWVYLENTLASDASWRRNAFKLDEYISLTDEVMIQFIASDSIRLGQNLDGGSLVEAAVDDLVIWEPEAPDNVVELTAGLTFALSPNPSSESYVNLLYNANEQKQVQIEVTDIAGRMVYRSNTTSLHQGNGSIAIPIEELANGSYQVNLISDQISWAEKLIIRR